MDREVYVEGRCKMYFPGKHRYCRLIPAKGKDYCGEHAMHDKTDDARSERVVCPLDPNHTVYKKNMTKHLKKCNSRYQDGPVYQIRGINRGSHLESDDSEDLKTLSLATADREEVMEVITKVNSLYEDLAIESQIKEANGNCLDLLTQEIYQQTDLSVKSIHHLQQIGSLLAQVSSCGALNNKFNFVELGAGRGGLSHWLELSLLEQRKVELHASENKELLKDGDKKEVSVEVEKPVSHDLPEVVLVDKAGMRYKYDNRQKTYQEVNFTRMRMNIENLSLGKISVLEKSNRPVVVISKHLCGDATDLSLRCIRTLNCPDGKKESASDESPATKKVCLDNNVEDRATGPSLACVMIALCCHHRCTWNQFTNPSFLLQRGIGPRQFKLIAAMTGWATCSQRRQRVCSSTLPSPNGTLKDSDEVEDDSEEHEQIEDAPSDQYWHHRYGNLTHSQREVIGLKCKRLLDWARVEYLRVELGLESYLCYYVKKDISPENVALVAHAKS